MKTLRRHRSLVGIINLIAISVYSTFGYADTLYKTNSGSTTFLDTATTTPTAPGAIIQNYAEGVAPSAVDILNFGLVTNNSTFRVSSTAATNLSLAGLTFVGNTGTVAIQNNDAQSQTLTLSGGIDLSRAGANVTISNATGGTVGLTLSNSAASTWNVQAGRSLTVNSVVTGSNGITVSPSTYVPYGGVVQLGASNAITGATAVNGSQLILDYGAAANRIDSASALNLNRARLTVQGSATFTQAVNGTNLGTGANLIDFGGTTASINLGAISRSGYDALLNVGTTARAITSTPNDAGGILGGWAVVNKSDWAVSGATITNLTAYTNRTGAWTAATGLNVLTTGSVTAVGNDTIHSLKIGGAHSVTQTAATTLNIASGGILKNDNTASTISGGTLTAGGTADGTPDTLYVWQNANELLVSSILANNGADTVNLVKAGDGSLQFSNTVAHTMSGDLVITGGRVMIGNNNTVGTLPGSNVIFALTPGSATGANDGALLFNRTDSATWTNNLTGVAGNDGTIYALRKLRAGTLTLNPTTANTFTGGVRIEGGTILAGSTTALSPNSKFQLDNTAGVTLNLGGFNNSIRGLTGAGTTGGTVTLGAGTLTLATLEIDNLSYAGTMTGTGGLIKNGLGTQALTRDLAYTGDTTVNAGSLSIGSLTGAGAVSVTAGSGTSLALLRNSSAASFASVANSALTLGTTTNAATLTVADGGTTIAGVIRQTSSAFAGGLTKNGAGTLVLSGGNAYTGTTTINDGILQLAASSPYGILADLSTVSVGATGTLDLNGNSETIGALSGLAGGTVSLGAGTLTVGNNNNSTDYAGAITGTGGLVKQGNGTLTLSGANTFTGSVAIRNNGGQSSGGLTLNSTTGAIADTVAIRNSGFNTSLTVNASETTGAVTSTANTTLSLGTGATLTSTYTNGAPVALGATADFQAAAGRVVRNINTSNLSPGMLITAAAAGIPAGSFITQILDGDTVLINTLPTATANDTAPSVTSVGVNHSRLTGAGGFTKDGTGLLILTGGGSHPGALVGPSDMTGALTLNGGTVQTGGIWTGSKYSIQDALSDSSALVFSGATAATLNFAPSATNLLPFERVGSIAGGLATSVINTTGPGTGTAGTAALAFGGDNTTTNFLGTFEGGAGGFLIKEGTGTFTWTNADLNAFDGSLLIDGGHFIAAGAEGMDGANVVRLQNSGTSFTVNETGGDTISLFQGGRGATSAFPNATVGASMANFVSNSDPAIINNTNLVVNSNTANAVMIFNGVISGAGNLTKDGRSVLELWGANTYTGNTVIDAGGTDNTTSILRLGAYSASAGLGAPTSGGQGSLSSSTFVSMTGTAATNRNTLFDVNGATQTIRGLTSTGTATSTVSLANGTLNINTTSGTSGTFNGVLSGNLNSVINLDATLGAGGWTLTGDSNSAFLGTLNVNGTSTLTLNRAGGTLGDRSRVHLGASGASMVVTLADTIGSLTGSGNVTLTQGLTLQEGRGGIYSTPEYSGIMSGAGALTLSNYGGITLSGANTYGGGTNVLNGSHLVLAYGSGSDVLPSTGALTLGGAYVTTTSSATTPAVLESVASTTLNAGASHIEALGSLQATTAINQGMGVGALGLGPITVNPGSALNFATGAASTTNSNVSGILGGWATFLSSTWAVSNTGSTAVSGLPTASYGANSFGAGVHSDITGTIAGGTTDTVRFNSAAASDITGTLDLAQGGILVTPAVGANTSTISAVLTSSLANEEIIIQQHNPQGDLVLSAVGGANTIITKAGGGKAIISSTLGGTGNAYIGAGYLQVGTGGTTGMVGGGTILTDGTFGVNRSDPVALSTVISGRGNLEQLGAGTTTLSAANTYSGRTTVRVGTLEVTNNSGLGAGFTAPTNQFANLTSVNSGATLKFSGAVTSVTELINLDGGTMDISTAGAATFAAPLVLSSSSTLSSGAGSTLTHILSGQILSLPGAGLTVNGVASGSTIAITNANNNIQGGITIGANASLMIGNNTSGNLGTTAPIVNNGTLTFNTNDANSTVPNDFTGTSSGTIRASRGNLWLTGDLSGYAGAIRVEPITNTNIIAVLGNDTYTPTPGTGPITIAGAAATFVGANGTAQFRTNLNQDTILSNNITFTPTTDGTNARSANFVRAGLGSLTLNGTLTFGATNGAPGTQRSSITTEAGGRLYLNATMSGLGANNLLNIANNGTLFMQGGTSNTYHGVLSGNNVWVFDNTGTTTLLGVNTVNSANSYLRKGTLVLGTAGTNTWQDDGDMQVLSGATLQIAGNETFDVLYSQRGATIQIDSGATLTLDGAAGQYNAGSFTGSGNLTLNSGNFLSLQGTNTLSGAITVNNGGIQSNNLANNLSSVSSITLGSGTSTGALDYIGPGETFNKTINIAGAGSTARITANGNGALTLSGPITNATGNNTLQLGGQTGGIVNPIKNVISGAITEGSGVLTLTMLTASNSDLSGPTGRWQLTNAANDFSGPVNIGVGILELGGDMTGTTTSPLGDLTATRVITLGTAANFDGRRYDSLFTGDNLGGSGGAGTMVGSSIVPSSSMGTLVFNDPGAAGTITLGSNISYSQPWNSTTASATARIVNDSPNRNVVLQGAFSSGTGNSGNRFWYLDGTNTGINTISGAIANPGSNATGVVKIGSGTWRLSGTNTYTGTTQIDNGVLQVSGGSAISDSGLVALNAAGTNGTFSGTARFHVVGSETIGTLTGNIGSEVLIDASQTLNIGGGANATSNGIVTGSGNLSKVVSGTAGGTQTFSAKHTYTGITTIGSTSGATANAGITVYHLANGGNPSGIGASSNAAANLVFATNSTGANGGILTWAGYTDQSTDRLFTVGLGTAGATIAASGSTVGNLSTGRLIFSNTGSLVYTGSGTRTITLGGTGLVENQFWPKVEDGGGATTIGKSGGGIWVLKGIANTHTGGLNITGGALIVENAGSVNGGPIVVNGGAGTGLLLRGGVTLNSALTNSTNDGGFGALTGTNVLSGNYTNTTNARLQARSGSSLEFSGIISGAGTILKLDSGTVIFSGNANTSTGATTVGNGVLRLDYSTNNNTKLADAAALTLGASSGVTALGADDNVAAVSYLTGYGPATLELVGGTHVEQVSATTLSMGSSTISRPSGTSKINLENISRAIGSGGTLNLSADAIATTNNLNGATGGLLTNAFVGTTATHMGAFATVGKNTWALSAASGSDINITGLATYGTDTYGTGINTDVTVAAATTGASTVSNTLRFNTNQATTLTLGAAFGVQGTAVGLQAGGILITPAVGAFPTIITGAPLQLAASTANLELFIHQHNTGGDLEISSVIQNNTAATAQNLTKSGAGRLILNALNTYTGNIAINEGVVQVGGSSAAPTTATNATLGGALVVGAGNIVGTIEIQKGAALNFLSTSTVVHNTSTVSGAGDINLLAGNTLRLQLDDNNGNWTGNLTADGGVVRITNAQANAIGAIQGLATFNSGSTLEFFGATAAIGRSVTFNDGALVTAVANGTTNTAASLAARITLNNAAPAGMTFTTDANQTLTLSGLVYGNNGFTKNGNGILALSANNFTNVYDSFTGLNTAPSLIGQVLVNAGILNLGNPRALGAMGAGNETVIASGASLDFRGQATNFGDDSDPSREIFKIAGAGVSGTGALRNTTGTGQFSHLVLDANATLSGGGFANGSRLDLSTFDTVLNNGNALDPTHFIRNQPTIAGNNFDLTIVGSSIGGNVILHNPVFSSALNSILISEGNLRIEEDVPPDTAWTGITAANITSGITLAYAGPNTAGDMTNLGLGLGSNVGSRLNFYRNHNTHHTVNITLDGTTAAANSGWNTIDINTDTIPNVTTFLDGDITLIGANNIIRAEDFDDRSTVVEQGNTTALRPTKLVIGGSITGTGGFTKTGFNELRLTNDNDFTGELNILRSGYTATNWQSNTQQINGVNYTTYGAGEAWLEWGLTLNGTNGAVSGVSEINLERRGLLTLDNTTRLDPTSGGVTGGNNNDRVNNAAVFNMNNGWLRINGGTVNNTESLGSMNLESGTSYLDLYPTDGAGTNMTLTLAALNRATGEGILRVRNFDPTSTFSTASAGESVRVALTSAAGLTQVGAGSGATDKSIALGVFGGTIPLGLNTDVRLLALNNGGVSDNANQQRNLQVLAGADFMTYDGGYLRPLDDSEYFSPANGVLSNIAAQGMGQNVNLTDLHTLMKEDTTINALRFGPTYDHNGSGGVFQTGVSALMDTSVESSQLRLDGKLTISSGMISSATFAIGNSADSSTYIMGGSVDFGAREGIINVINGVFRTTDATVFSGTLQLRSKIEGTAGIHKTGPGSLYLTAENSYSGVTQISEGNLFAHSAKNALGVGGAGNGVVITGSGNLRMDYGTVIGSPTAPEDILLTNLSGDPVFLYSGTVSSDNNVLYGDVILDNVDRAGQILQTARVRIDNFASNYFYGDFYGGPTVPTSDVVSTDSRLLQFDSNDAGHQLFIFRGQFGDRGVAGVATPVEGLVTSRASVPFVTSNENEVLRVNLSGGNDATSFIMGQQYNAAGRLTLARGQLIIDYDPAASVDGTGFWTNTAISRIANADSVTTAYNVNGGTTHQGFIMGTTANSVSSLFLNRPDQSFNMATWNLVGSGAKYIGGLNSSGTVTFGNGTGTLSITNVNNSGTNTTQFYAMSGGTTVLNQRLNATNGTAPSNFNFVKNGRGTLTLKNTALATAASADANFVLAGGTLVLEHTGGTVQALVGNQNARFDGGTFISLASTGANTTASIATDNAADRVLNFNLGGTEIIARTNVTNRNMVLNMGNGNANNNAGGTPRENLTRNLGTSVNFVEDNSSISGGTAQITLNFNATTSALRKNQVIPWATYGTLARTATDFAMVDAGNSNDVRAFARATDEFKNDVSTWAADQDISETTGAGFFGALGGNLSISTLRFDTNADSTVNVGANTLTVAGTGLTQSSGAILVSSNVGSANKTITGSGALTTTGGRNELIFHNYSNGNLNVNVPITGTGTALIVAGPSTVDANTIGTTGAVVLGATNTFTGKVFINGGILSFNSATQLPNPGASTTDQITMSGGTLRFTGTGYMDMLNRGLTLLGSGGTIDVTDGSAELAIRTNIASNALYRGDLVKVGAGTLNLMGANGNNGNFQGLLDVRQGTLRLNGDTGNAGAGTTNILGTNNSYADGTIMRTGTSLAIQMGNGNDSGEWNIDEWITFEGGNYLTVGTINTQTANTATLTPAFPNSPNNERPVNLNGTITINGALTVDTVPSQILRLSNGAGVVTGSGDIIKDGQGQLEFRSSQPEWTGNLVIKQGTVYAINNANMLGTGYTTGKTITLGSNDRQGTVSLLLQNPDNVHGLTTSINHDINVVYNPTQTKRLGYDGIVNGSEAAINGNITLNDNLIFLLTDDAEIGGSQSMLKVNGNITDGALTSGNITLQSDDRGGGANDNFSGRPVNYLVLNGNNSGWTGDFSIGSNTSYDHDQVAVLRAGSSTALTAANDVVMNYNSIFQVGGQSIAIGTLTTNGGDGNYYGQTANVGASSNGSTEIIENASSSAATLTITQTTPAVVEARWDAHFRDGTLNSQFFAPGTNTHQPSAALNIVKAGSGWATMTVDNNYTGTTSVTGGILQVGRNGVGDTGAAGISGTRFTSADGTVVAGTGVIQGNAAISGILRPGDEAGNHVGTLTVNGSLTLASTSQIIMQVQRASYTAFNALGYGDPNYSTWIGGLSTDATYSHLMDDPVTAGQHDQLLVNGTFTAGGKVTLMNNGYVPSHGDVFKLIDWSSISGTYNVGGTALSGGLWRTGGETGLDLELFELGGGWRWDVSLFNTLGVVVVVIPEPSKALFLLLGLLALFFRRRRE